MQPDPTRAPAVTDGPSDDLALAESLAGFGHWRLDFATGAVAWSDGLYRIYGVARGEFEPTFDAVTAAYHPDDRAELAAHVARARAGDGFRYTLRLNRPGDGAARVVSAYATVRRGPDGAPAELFGVLQDVTESEAARRGLAESEAKYRQLADAAADVIASYGLDGTFSYVSPVIETVLGYAPAELVGRKTWEIIHPDDHAEVARRFMEVVRAGPGAPPTRVEYRALHKDGAIVRLEAQPRPRFDSTGRAAEFHDVVRDVTERRRTADALQRSEARFRLVTESADDIVTELDRHGRFSYVSPSATRVTGWAVEEVLGREALDFIVPADREAARAGFGAILRSGAGGSLEYRLMSRDGRLIWMEARPTVMRDPVTGRVTGISDVIRDITVRKATEAALADSEARYRILADDASDIVTQTDLAGYFMYVSPAVLPLTGYTAPEVVGRQALEFVHPEDRTRVEAEIASALASPEGRHIEHRLTRKDGAVIWIESRPKLARDPATGRPFAVIDAMRDVTARKALEFALERARAEAEAAGAVKAEFLSNMSHELRTPLTSILGFSSMLASEAGLSAQGRRAVERVAGSGQALLTVVNDILDFSRLEAGQVEIAPRPVDLTPVLRESLGLLEPQAAAKGLRLDFTAVGPLPARVELDEERLRQVLVNLIGNAVKFTDRGGVELRVAYDAPARRLRCEVIDTGVGIAPDRLDRLFKRFSQVDGSTTRAFGGTGLGLAICRGLVTAMGGEIGVDSVVGRGSRFSLDLPVRAPAEPELGAGPAGAEHLPGLRLLVADDNALMRELVRLMLAPHGVEITEAASGEQALATASEQPFDLIVMEPDMPGLGGAGAARALRDGGGPNDLTPVLALTADAGEGGDGPSPFDGRVAKPLVPTDLIAALARWAEPYTPLADARSGRIRAVA